MIRELLRRRLTASRDFVGRSVFVSAVKAGQAAAALVATLVLAAALGPAGMGDFERAMSLPLMFAPIARMSGAHAALGMRGRGHITPTAMTSVVAVVVLGVVTALLLISVVGVYVSELGISTLSALLVVTTLYGTKEILKALSWIRGDAVTDNAVAAIISLLRLTTFAAVWVIGGLTVDRALWLIAGIWLLSLSFYSRSETRRNADLAWTRERGAVSRCLRIAAPVTVNLLALGLLLRLDILLLDAFDVEPSEIGRYGIAVRLAEALWLVPLAVAQVFVVDAARESSERRSERTELQSLIRNTTVAVLCGAVLLYVVVVVVVRSWAESYRGSETLLLLLVPGIVAYSAVPTMRNHIILSGSLAKMTAVAIAAVAVNVVLNVVLIPALGVRGAPIATSIAYGTLFIGMVSLSTVEPRNPGSSSTGD